MAVVTLRVQKVETAPLTINMAVPGLLSGYFKGHAKIMSVPDRKALGDRIDNGDFKDKDEELLREMYTGFDGIPNSQTFEPTEGEDAWSEVLRGKWSSYLSMAALQAWYAQYVEARRGNSDKSHSR